MASDEKCFICEKSLSIGQTTSVKARGLTNFKKASDRRGDGKKEKLEGLLAVTVHDSCRKEYTREHSIIAALKRQTANQAVPITSPIKSKLRSSVPCFEFKNKCFYCAETIDLTFHEKEKKKHADKRIKVYNVRTLLVKDSILQAARKRNDKWSREVKQRIETVSDLVAVEAKYHDPCSVNFFKNPPTGKKGGRPPVDDVKNAMEVIFDFIENSDECQFSLPDLINLVEGYVPDERTIKKKLEDKYGDDIIISKNQKRVPVVSFRSTGHKILTDHWYTKRKVNQDEERLRIVRAAAAIIREDIRTQVYDISSYPPSDDFLKVVNSCIPESLDVLLKDVITKGRKCEIQPLERKCSSIAHAIISATRPRSFLSPLQISIAVFLYRKFGSKNLLTLLSNLGFSASYNEAQLLEASATLQPELEITPKSFCQFVFDNADFNVSTLDGLNTFHSMGGIECVTPATAILPAQPIIKITKAPTNESIGRPGVLSLRTFENLNGRGLRNIGIEALPCLVLEESVQMPSMCDVLWMCGKFFEIADIPGWRGFMEILTAGQKFERTKVLCLPFVNSPPTHYDTIYTVLCKAVEEAQKLGLKTTFVTFDQLLYMKARDIVSAVGPDSDLSNVVVRLGGFHLLMSFLGCIGFIMAGSGLKELLSVIYAPLSVDKILTGHAYARAIRGHLLTQLALAKTIFKDIDFNTAEREGIQNILRDFTNDPPTVETIAEETVIEEICGKIRTHLQEVEKNGPTAKLWMQYFHMVTLVKQFIQVEREGNWSGHLQTIQQMLPFFHASGHFPYAKAGHLYLQDMLNLESHMEIDEYHKFVDDGYFTIRRTNKYWSGTWSDMVIEQNLMRSMKVVGGITGRGFTDSVLSKWILAMPALHQICESLEEYSGTAFVSGEQHVDSRESRIERDDQDVKRLENWLVCHDPFQACERIMSISTGVVGDDKINCHNAVQIGTKAIEAIVAGNFKDVKMKRDNRVRPLATINSAIKLYDVEVPIDPLMLFQRIAIAKKDEAELVEYLEYELAPFPLALFNEAGMRKTTKSVLYDIFEESRENLNYMDCTYVIDGGYLLHRVVWHQNQTYESICTAYIDYVKNNFGARAVIVFDGYTDSSSSTKTTEQRRRSVKHSSADILFDVTMVATVTQEKFLCNDKNKSRLISLLTERFENEGVEVRQAQDDADTLIVTTAIELSSSAKIIVVGEDIDLLVLLTALAPQERNIHFTKPAKGKVERKIYSSHILQSQKGLQDMILFAHAFTGCDTTSCLFQKGKRKCLKLLEQRDDLQDIVRIFNDANATHEEIAQAGERFFLAVYNAPASERSLNRHRYQMFKKFAYKSNPNLALLPSTAAAAQQHSFRVYHQIQKWRGNEKSPELWGWKKVNNFLEPVRTLKAPAPDSVLTLVSCNCKKGCTSSCGCRKAGLKCAAICGHCQGTACFNSDRSLDFEKEGSIERELDDGLLSTSQSRDEYYDIDAAGPDEPPDDSTFENATPSTSRMRRF